MKKDRIKISKEFHGIGGSMWVGMEAQIEETDDVKQCIIELNNDVEAGYHALNPGVTYGAGRQEITFSSGEQEDKEFEELKRRLQHMEYREDAINLIINNGFRLNVELNKIANDKPARPTSTN